MSLNLSRNLKQRLLFGSIGLALLGIAIVFAHHPTLRWIFISLCTAMICGALWEFYQIAKEKDYLPLSKIGVIATAFYVIAIYYDTQYSNLSPVPPTILGGALIAAFLYYFIKGTDPFVNLALTLFGIFYLTVPLSTALGIVYFPYAEGQWWFLYALAITKVTDIAAYTFGKLWGTNQFTPYISPKKTWEGALGGFVVAIVLSYFLNRWIPLGLSAIGSIILGAVTSALAQFGDLAESLLKRDSGVKDSNRQIPGLGGLLDILDSLVFTLPFIYLFLKYYYGSEG